ncbi:MAG: FAD-binding protein [Candidatus Daviesbacteria bacterium]|nr:FAD-binding protein [Candidatus Daviesbacteria bacterium]
MDSKYKLIIDSFGKDRFKFNEPLKNHTTSGFGGPARIFFIAFSAKELIKIISMCRQLGLPYFLFGSGSKIMISDLGFDGLIIKNRIKDIQTISVKGKVTKYGIGVQEAAIEAESGLSIKKWVEYLNAQNLEALEFMNLPGTIGGNLFLSKSLQNHAKSIKVLDLRSEIIEIAAENLNPRKHIIISAVFRIKAKK